MSMTEARTKLGASDNLFKKVYQGLKARDVIEYIKNDLNIHKKIITVAERNVRLTQKYIKENLHDGPEDGPDFTLLYKEPIASQVFAYAQHMGDRGFTQRDISSEIMRGYGRLEPRNIVRNMLEKHKLIKKAGKREVGRQRHDLYQSKCPTVNNSLKLGLSILSQLSEPTFVSTIKHQKSYSSLNKCHHFLTGKYEMILDQPMAHLVHLKWNVEKKFFSISFLKLNVSQAGLQIDQL